MQERAALRAARASLEREVCDSRPLIRLEPKKHTPNLAIPHIFNCGTSCTLLFALFGPILALRARKP